MTTQEVINEFNWLRNISPRTIKIWDSTTIKSFEIAIDVLKKQIPKKPVETEFTKRCPACGRRLITKNKTRSMSYCARCGQAIDWSDSELVIKKEERKNV